MRIHTREITQFIALLITSVVAGKNTVRITDQVHGAGGPQQSGLPGMQPFLGSLFWGACSGSLGHVFRQGF